MSADSLGDRMKGYEEVPRNRLTRRTPVIIRLDGKAFHTLTEHMPRPWCRDFHECMWAAAKDLCEEVVNYFVWRQQDATRNAINAAGQSLFTHGQLQGKNTSQVQEMMFQAHGVNFNDYPVPQKRGACVVKERYLVQTSVGVWGNRDPHDDTPTEFAERTRWVVDEDIPVFTQDRNYVQKLVDLLRE